MTVSHQAFQASIELTLKSQAPNTRRNGELLSSNCESVGDSWDGETGLITDVVKRLVSSGMGKEAYMCGPAAMIDAAIIALTRLGVEEAGIFYDKFVTKADTAR